ncbi:NADP-dependent oxidoreductase domain-containing protein [Crucibulum laeve]|uniref:NADP-dependent oxidoreductase domain-containing protein n=1 Tax=Crucibulum laeve TaxID=68775 RepID=A0A5C3MB20_9AGAR|nr:NADP-dependent oxidoreductase domain-containing protein [Crucibulum laeve]
MLVRAPSHRLLLNLIRHCLSISASRSRPPPILTTKLNMSTTSKPTFTLNDGTSVPWLAFGTGTALYGKDAAESVKQAIETGITHLDGAQMYNNEETLAAGIKASGKPRSELYIVTKLKPPQPGQTVKGLLQESLKKLGTDYVDLFLIHTPRPANQEGKLKEQWKAMEEVHEEGLAKSIGVSNFRVEDLQVVLDGAKIVPAVNQIELHPYVWKAAEPIVALGKKHGIVPASYGGLTPIVRVPGGPVDSVVETVRSRLEKTRGASVSAGQVLTKWILHKGAFVVTTTSKASRIKEFQDVEDLPDLTTEEVKGIDEAGAELHKRVYMGKVFED